MIIRDRDVGDAPAAVRLNVARALAHKVAHQISYKDESYGKLLLRIATPTLSREFLETLHLHRFSPTRN